MSSEHDDDHYSPPLLMEDFSETSDPDREFTDVADALATPSKFNKGPSNEPAVDNFEMLCRVRHTPHRCFLAALPLRTDLFDFYDPLLVPRPQFDNADFDDPTTTLPASSFLDNGDVDAAIACNPFYKRAMQGQRTFRTPLALLPLTPSDGSAFYFLPDDSRRNVIAVLFNRLLAPTAADFMNMGANDCPEECSPRYDSGNVTFTTAYIDPVQDLVHDIDGNTWRYASELHAVTLNYTYWREIHARMEIRNGRVNRSHLLLFAAMRVACLLRALSCASINSRYTLRRFMLAIFSGAMYHIRLYKLLLKLVPHADGEKFAQVHAVEEIDGIGIAVRSTKTGNHVTVLQSGAYLEQLVIKAVLEGANYLDETKDIEAVPVVTDDPKYSAYKPLLETFLGMLKKVDGCGNQKTEALEFARALIALVPNSTDLEVRRHLVESNVGLCRAVRRFVEHRSKNFLQQHVGSLRGLEDPLENDGTGVAQLQEDISVLCSMSVHGVCADECNSPLGDTLIGPSLHTLGPPSVKKISLFRNSHNIGELCVGTERQFNFHRIGARRVGVGVVFQTPFGAHDPELQICHGLQPTHYDLDRCDVETIVNACLSCNFGPSAAIFVLEHLLFGGLDISETCDLTYLKHAPRQADAVFIRSYLHPEVVSRIAVFAQCDTQGERCLSFDGVSNLGKEVAIPFFDRVVVCCLDSTAVLNSMDKQTIGHKFMA